VIFLENNEQICRYALEQEPLFSSDVGHCFQMVSSDYVLFFCDFVGVR
jgi:hypothetical protein